MLEKIDKILEVIASILVVVILGALIIDDGIKDILSDNERFQCYLNVIVTMGTILILRTNKKSKE